MNEDERIFLLVVNIEILFHTRIYGLHPFCKKKIECPPKVMFACIYSACLVSVLSALALM
jgi:hypothetical protein